MSPCADWSVAIIKPQTWQWTAVKWWNVSRKHIESIYIRVTLLLERNETLHYQTIHVGVEKRSVGAQKKKKWINSLMFKCSCGAMYLPKYAKRSENIIYLKMYTCVFGWKPCLCSVDRYDYLAALQVRKQLSVTDCIWQKCCHRAASHAGAPQSSLHLFALHWEGWHHPVATCQQLFFSSPINRNKEETQPSPQDDWGSTCPIIIIIVTNPKKKHLIKSF